MEDSVAESVSLRFTLNIDPSIVRIRIIVGLLFVAAADWIDSSSNSIVVKRDLMLIGL
jgi:hypothetical protein